MIKVSIIIPTYNLINLLKRALKSIPRRKDLEIIIIDDFSTDGSWEYLNKGKEDNIDLFGDIILRRNDKNLGCSVGKNGAYGVATGEYLITLDSDDYYYTEVFNKILDDLYLYTEDIIHIDNKVNDGNVGNDKSRCATWSYFAKNSFLKEHNFTYSPGGYRGRDGYLFQDILKVNFTERQIHEVAYHYNYPREGSVVGNYNHGK